MNVKMFLITLVLFIIINHVTSVTINDFTLKVEPGNLIINAILTDESNGQQFITKEYVSIIGDTIRGKIKMETDGSTMSIYYSTELPNTRNLLYQDKVNYVCTLFKYSNQSWDHQMDTCSGQFVSDILIIGPSLVFRLKQHPFNLTIHPDVEINGILHNQYKTVLTSAMEITFYLKADRVDNDLVDITKSTWILFKALPGTIYNGQSVKMDIKSIEQTNQYLDSIVTFQPEKLCLNNLTIDLPDYGSTIDIFPETVHSYKLYSESGLMSTDSSNEPEKDSSQIYCTPEELNLIKKFSKIESRKFIKPKSKAIDVTLSNCAQLCLDTDQCKSFHYCSESLSCAFGDLSTDSSTDSINDCDIFVPKVINKFKMTGKLIASEPFHIKTGFSVDQCAELCHRWTNDNGFKTCSSFNYCPAEGTMTSMCMLSSYSTEYVIKDNQENHKDSGECLNYDLIIFEDKKVTKNSIGFHSNLTLIIILVILLCIFGLILGFIVNLIIARMKNSENKYMFSTFDWSKQSISPKTPLNQPHHLHYHTNPMNALISQNQHKLPN